MRNVKLFWDIDGTLLRTNGAAAIPFAKAVSDFAGFDVIIDRKKVSGHTDYEIVINLLHSVGVTTDIRNITMILENYASNLPESLKNGVVEKIGNIEQTLGILLDDPSLELAIGTGNCFTGARIKLNHVSLLTYFDYKNLFCASENHWSRGAIIKNAKNSLMPNQIGIVIGDSPRDILSAKASGLKNISVATGGHSCSELSVYEPDLILESGWNIKDLAQGINKLIAK
jgi:phosphoglycolate phosphatase-like HAD superfamily hydrolase